MLLDANKSCLLLVDVQEKLTPFIHDKEQVIANSQWLLELAHTCDIPLLISEQYPKGLGKTLPELLECAPGASVMEKLHFSCAADESCLSQIEKVQRYHIVVIGIEAHVCVLQTAIQLQEHGKQVFVVADAVGSREFADVQLALRRMRGAGVEIISREMVFFEWLRVAGTKEFKELSQRFMQ